MTAAQELIVALPTPFRAIGIDVRALGDLVEWQISEGSDALAVGGVTGEWPALSAAETEILVRAAVQASAGRARIHVGIVTSSTERCVKAGLLAEQAGADALIVTCPPYSKPTQEGLIRHFEMIVNKVGLPIMVHDDPSRTRVSLGFEAIRRLSRLDRIMALVDGLGDAARASLIVKAGEGRLAPFAGTDAAALLFCASGGVGCLSIAANVSPRLCQRLQLACRSDDWTEARQLFGRLQPVSDALCSEGYPAALKWCISQFIQGYLASVRLPLVEASLESKQRVLSAVSEAKIFEVPASCAFGTAAAR